MRGGRWCLSAAVAARPPGLQDSLVALCKRRGFVQPGSELYGGLKGTFDYGPPGAAMRSNLRSLWLRDFVERRADCLLVETPILMRAEVWKAAGHVDSFCDPLVECKSCHHRVRADALPPCHPRCEVCGKSEWTGEMQFNLMMSTGLGARADQSTYLRPETAQGIFCAAKFASLAHMKMPFGMGQVGKAFRNEISPGNFLFRAREFEQMELEFFVRERHEAEKWFRYWVEYCHSWLLRYGLSAESTRIVAHDQASLSHYSSATSDVEFLFPHGWGELWGIANRTDFDLRAHAKHSGVDLSFRDENEAFYPHVIEPSVGLDRLMYAILTDAYANEVLSDGTTREVLRLHPQVAPWKFAVLPLLRRPEMMTAAADVHRQLLRLVPVDLMQSGSVGKRYRRHDEVGTPYCVTIDQDTLVDGTVTLRHRDSMQQERVTVAHLAQRARAIKLGEDEE